MKVYFANFKISRYQEFVSNIVVFNKFNIYTYHLPMKCTLSVSPIGDYTIQDSVTVTDKNGEERWIHFEDPWCDKELKRVCGRMFGI